MKTAKVFAFLLIFIIAISFAIREFLAAESDQSEVIVLETAIANTNQTSQATSEFLTTEPDQSEVIVENTVVTDNNQDSKATPDISTNDTGWVTLDVKEDTQGAISVEVKPIKLDDPGDSLGFNISLNTHSVDLSMDLASLSTLSTNNGLSIDGTFWDATTGGHHLSGVLMFSITEADISLLEKADELTLTILNLDVPERVFNWNW